MADDEAAPAGRSPAGEQAQRADVHGAAVEPRVGAFLPGEAPVTPGRPVPAALSQPMAAALMMLASLVFFVSMGVFIRLAAAEVHTLEVVFFRNFFALLLLSPLLMRSGLRLMASTRPGLHVLRALLNVTGMMAGFTALTMIPLAEATALGFTAPLFATLGALLILGEVVRARRLAALAAGFLGVLVVLGPSLSGLSPGALLALVNALLLAATTLIVKRLTATDGVGSIMLWMVLLSSPLSLVPALFVWTWPSPMALLWLVALAAAGTLGHYFWTRACSLADITQLQPIEFAKLPLTALAGYLIFAEAPAATVWIGGAIIFASTVYITRREALVAR